MRSFSPDIINAIELPRIVGVKNNLYASVFELMKLLPAHFILNQAEKDGLIKEGSLIIETSSGTFALALAMIAAIKKYRLIIVSDPAIDRVFLRRLNDLNARVEICRKPEAVGGFQGARLNRMSEIMGKNPGYFWPNQYFNPLNQLSYARVAELIAETLGEIDYLVGPVGSGGSMCGTSRYLRRIFPEMKAIAVDTQHSVLFGHPNGKRVLRGLGNSLMPGNVDHTVFDEVHWVSADAAFAATRKVHREKALFCGPTSGAAYLVADWISQRKPDAKIAFICPDTGNRYLTTVYNDGWLKKNGLYRGDMPEEPVVVDHPDADIGPWSCFKWNRRSHAEVMRPDYSGEEK